MAKTVAVTVPVELILPDTPAVPRRAGRTGPIRPGRYPARVVTTSTTEARKRNTRKTSAAASKARKKTSRRSKKTSVRKASGTARDDFSLAVLKLLAAEVGYLCSNPTCCAPTVGPSKQKGISNVGVGAHITAAAKGGPRFNKRLTRVQRVSADNGIWMCHRCGRLVDNDAKSFTVGLLRNWKRSAIKRAHSDLQAGTRNSRLRTPADVVAAVRAGTRAERESQLALEAVTASDHVLDVLANATNRVEAAHRELLAGRYDVRELTASVDEVEKAWTQMDRVARAVEALWDADEARPCWRLTNFTSRQINGMRHMLSVIEVAGRGEKWTGHGHGAEILDREYMGQLGFVTDVEIHVADIDAWANKPLHRKRKNGVRYEWPG